MTGWIPDALIPTDAIEGRGGFPVDVGKNQNQGFWIDVELPRDQKNFPAGEYDGSDSCFTGRKNYCEIPFEITLLPYYLPDEDKQQFGFIHLK